MSAPEILEEVGLGLLRAAAAAGGDAIVSWLRGAVAASPDHPLSRRVAEILPAESESERTARALRGG